MNELIAEVIAIGDELTSGQRLDTNSQWMSRQLGDLGIRTAFHSTVGDDLQQILDVFRIAVQRANIVVCSGGLGPTADDLTREAIASTAGVELVRNAEVVEHIQQMYRIRNREMPASNLCQADFPAGSVVIDNPEGTAPGVDMTFAEGSTDQPHECRFFALPGVPAELKQMWARAVHPALQTMTGAPAIIHHRTLHVFGEGESKIESMLPDLVKRGNDPTTGITASAATITLRVSTSAASVAACNTKIEPVLQTIRSCLGDLVFGSDGQTLADVVTQRLTHQSQTLAIADGGLQGEVASSLARADENHVAFRNAVLLSRNCFQSYASPKSNTADALTMAAAEKVRADSNVDFGIAIEPIDRDTAKVDAGSSMFHVAIAGPAGTSVQQYSFRGHSSWRQQRAIKQVLNQVRFAISNGV